MNTQKLASNYMLDWLLHYLWWSERILNLQNCWMRLNQTNFNWFSPAGIKYNSHYFYLCENLFSNAFNYRCNFLRIIEWLINNCKMGSIYSAKNANQHYFVPCIISTVFINNGFPSLYLKNTKQVAINSTCRKNALSILAAS